MQVCLFNISCLYSVYIQCEGFAKLTILILTSMQALEVVRGCHGLNLVGCDLVEVSPPYDTTGATAILAANLLYEMLCVLPGVPRRR